MARALQIFLNADLRCSHEGLTIIAKKEKIDVDKLVPGEYVIFINTQKNKVKLYAANQIVAYLRLPRGHIDLRVIQLIPKAFESKGRIDYDQSLKEMLQRELPERSYK